MFENRNVYKNPIEAILNLIISPIIFVVFGLLWIILYCFTTYKLSWVFGAISLLFLVISIYSLLNEFILFKLEKKGHYLKFREILKIPIISLLIFVLILSISFGVWFRINNPPDYHGRNTIEVRILGDNEGENFVELDIYLDYERIYPLKSKVNSEYPDQNFPVWFHMNMTTNITILFNGLNENQIFHYNHSNLSIHPYLEGTAFALI